MLLIPSIFYERITYKDEDEDDGDDDIILPIINAKKSNFKECS